MPRGRKRESIDLPVALDEASVFFVFCQTKSLRAAGERLGMAPATVKVHIHHLADVGFNGRPLIEDTRAGTGAVLTPFGRVVWQRCADAQVQLQNIWREATYDANALTICASGVGVRYRVPQVLAEWRQLAGNEQRRVIVSRAPGRDIPDQLRMGLATFGVGGFKYSAADPKTFDFCRYRGTVTSVVLPRSGSRPDLEYTSPEEFTPERINETIGWIMPVQSVKTVEIAKKLVGKEPNVHTEVETQEDCIHFVSLGLGATIAPDIFLDKYGSSISYYTPQLEDAFDHRFPGALIWLKGRMHAPWNEQFRDIFRKHFHDSDLDDGA